MCVICINPNLLAVHHHPSCFVIKCTFQITRVFCHKIEDDGNIYKKISGKLLHVDNALCELVEVRGSSGDRFVQAFIESQRDGCLFTKGT